MTSFRFILPILFLLNIPLLFGEDNPERSCVITERTYSIEGMTRQAALEKELKIPDSPEFSTYREMELFAEGIKQDLLNLRLFTEVEIELVEQTSSYEAPSGDSPRRFLLHINLVDSWTFFPLLVPGYNTNDSLKLEMKIRYSNFFGTLIDFSIDGDFGLVRDPEADRLRMGFWEVTTSFANINLGKQKYKIYWVQKYDSVIKMNGETIDEDYTYNSSDFFVETEFDLKNDYYYRIAPALELNYNYHDRTGRDMEGIDREPHAFSIYQNFGNDRVNWQGTFREGLLWDAGFNSRLVTGDSPGLKGNLILQNRWYLLLHPRVSYTNRNLFITSIRDEQHDLGEYMRGVPDVSLYGHTALFSNNSLPVRTLKWPGVFELQVQPFIDMGAVYRKEMEFSPSQDLRMSAGSDFIVFFDKMTSIQLRATVGYDLFSGNDPSDRYELLFSTSLFY